MPTHIAAAHRFSPFPSERHRTIRDESSVASGWNNYLFVFLLRRFLSTFINNVFAASVPILAQKSCNDYATPLMPAVTDLHVVQQHAGCHHAQPSQHVRRQHLEADHPGGLSRGTVELHLLHVVQGTPAGHTCVCLCSRTKVLPAKGCCLFFNLST